MTPLRVVHGAAHQRRADTAVAIGRIDGERPEQKGLTAGSGHDLPEPDRADHAAVLDRDERQSVGGIAAFAQLVRGLAEADRTVGGVEQLLAPPPDRPLRSRRMVTIVISLRGGQMWTVFSGAKPLKATAA